MVMVMPELSKSAVLIVGNQNGVIVSKGSMMLPGDAVAPAATVGAFCFAERHAPGKKNALQSQPDPEHPRPARRRLSRTGDRHAARERLRRNYF